MKIITFEPRFGVITVKTPGCDCLLTYPIPLGLMIYSEKLSNWDNHGPPFPDFTFNFYHSETLFSLMEWGNRYSYEYTSSSENPGWYYLMATNWEIEFYSKIIADTQLLQELYWVACNLKIYAIMNYLKGFILQLVEQESDEDQMPGLHHN